MTAEKAGCTGYEHLHGVNLAGQRSDRPAFRADA
jgi:hypothetical protein